MLANVKTVVVVAITDLCRYSKYPQYLQPRAFELRNRKPLRETSRLSKKLKKNS